MSQITIKDRQMLPSPNTFEQHNFKNSENTLYFRNKNPALKIMHSGKIDPEDNFVFWI